MQGRSSSRLKYHSSLDQVHAPIDDYEGYSMEYQQLHDQSWRASFPHPQSDDYFDGVDPYSSPTPLPRQSIGGERRVMEFGMHESSSPRVHDQEDDVFRYSYEYRAYIRLDRQILKNNTPYANQASCSLSKNLIPISALPDWCRSVFKFGVFNAMQSQCFDTAVNTNSNMVISAPTGAGKTVLFELSVIRLLQSESNASQATHKCVYMAPTKAICSERSRDWSAKFAHLGVKCCEITGDTMKSGRSAWKEAKDCAIIITTPEKWDSLTRNWNDSSEFLQYIKLFMVDEVHTIAEPTRGSCLEVVVSRMMQRGNLVRFVLVSATAPNIEDLKDWLSSCSSGQPTSMFKFGDEYRPCQLQRHVYGYTRPPGHNDFQFMKTLDYKLFPIIQEHSSGKPVLVFCPTRKSVMATASHLMGVCQGMSGSNETLPWSPPRGLGSKFSEPQLQGEHPSHSYASHLITPHILQSELANFGIGVHHAGLSLDERHTVEELFTQRKLSVIIATSTLAVGVNFPAHIVIIKGVTQWAGTGWTEYSSQDIMQMLGRAGRPQFDREGIAIVMCDKNLENKYKLLATGGSRLESTLHSNLTEHINSEIGLDTIKSVDSAKQWLRKTFLFRRIQKNPAHYKLNSPETASWEECVDALVTKSISVLKETRLVKHKENEDILALTQFGEIMSRYYIRQSTMKLFIEFAHENSAGCLRSVLTVLSGAEEFKDLHMRGGERQVYNKLNENESIRFPLKKAETSANKVFLLIQAILGGVPLMSAEFKSPNSQPHMEALSVMRHAPRMITALVDTALITKNGTVVLNGMSLMRCLNGKVWEDRPVVLKQLDGIGEKSYKVLAENDITTIKLLSVQDPNRIEMLLNRRPPFGSDIISSARALPSYSVFVEELSSGTNKTSNTVDIELLVTVSAKCALTKDNHVPTKGIDTRVTSILTITSDNQFVDFRRISTRRLLESVNFSIMAPLTRPSQEVVIIVSSDKFAGITERYNFKPSLSEITYPIPNTRPPKPMQVEDTGEDVLDLTKSDTPEEPTPGSAKRSKEKPSFATGSTTTRVSKTRLPNGNYACHHKCKDKTACRHLCCREGLFRPPPSPKNVKPKVNTDDTLSSPTNSQQRPKNTAEKQKAHLNYFHNKASDGVSRIKRDLLIPTQDSQPTLKATEEYTDSLFSSPMKTPAPKLGKKSSGSDQDLPEPSLIRVGERASSKSGSTNYDDSDMDQWVANLPSELLESDVETPALSAWKDQSDHRSSRITSSIVKRPIPKDSDSAEQRPKRSRTKLPSVDELPVAQDTPLRKRPVVEVLPTPHSSSTKFIGKEPKPLFRPSSSVGLLSPGTSNHLESEPKAPVDEDPLEGFMDYIFEGVKIVTRGTSEDTSEEPNTECSTITRSSPGREQPSHKFPLKMVQQPTKVVQTESGAPASNGSDPMADFNSWLDENGL